MDATTRQRRPGNRTGVLRARVEPDLVERVRQLQTDSDLISESDAVRHLVHEGLEAMSRPRAPKPKSPLALDQYVERTAGHLEALTDLLDRLEAEDPEAALVLSERITKRLQARNLRLKKRVTK